NRLSASRTPRFEVRIISACEKSAVRPRASVKRPSPSTCSKRSCTSGEAFSTSSKSTTANGCRRMARVSKPSGWSKVPTRRAAEPVGTLQPHPVIQELQGESGTRLKLVQGSRSSHLLATELDGQLLQKRHRLAGERGITSITTLQIHDRRDDLEVKATAMPPF